MGGYWLVAADGGTFSYGDAKFNGSLPALKTVPAAPVDGIIAVDPGGYWMFSSDGGVYAFGDAVFNGSAAPFHPASPTLSGGLA